MCILKGEYDVHADMKFKTYKFIARGGEMMDTNTIIFALLGLIVGAVVGFFVCKSIAEAKIAGAKSSAEQIIDEGTREAEALKKKLY